MSKIKLYGKTWGDCESVDEKLLWLKKTQKTDMFLIIVYMLWVWAMLFFIWFRMGWF